MMQRLGEKNRNKFACHDVEDAGKARWEKEVRQEL